MPLSINFDPDCDFNQRRSLARRESPYFAVVSKYTIFNAWIRCRDFACGIHALPVEAVSDRGVGGTEVKAAL